MEMKTFCVVVVFAFSCVVALAAQKQETPPAVKEFLARSQRARNEHLRELEMAKRQLTQAPPKLKEQAQVALANVKAEIASLRAGEFYPAPLESFTDLGAIGAPTADEGRSWKRSMTIPRSW